MYLCNPKVSILMYMIKLNKSFRGKRKSTKFYICSTNDWIFLSI